MGQHDFELHEGAGVFHDVEVNPGSVDKVNPPALSYSADDAERTSETLAQHAGRLYRADPIVTDLRRWLILAAVVNELTGSIGELTQFQAAIVASEERIVLDECQAAHPSRPGKLSLRFPRDR